MDRPIFMYDALRGAGCHVTEEDIETGYAGNEDLIEYALAHDDKDTLIEYMQWLDPVARTTELLNPFLYDSVKFANAVIETGSLADYNAIFVRDMVPPLHRAAMCLAPSLTKLFLDHNGGALANLRCDGHLFGKEGMQLPLNLAIENLRAWCYHSWKWYHTESTFKLVRSLCYPSYRFALETVRLLVQNTTEIENEIYYYAKEGKVFELAVLLMVAHEKVMISSFPQENDLNGRTTIRPFVLSKIASLSVLDELSTMNTYIRNLFVEHKDKKAKLEKILLLLEIFERVGEDISMFLRLKETSNHGQSLSKELAWIFKEGGFDVAHEMRNGGLLLRSIFHEYCSPLGPGKFPEPKEGLCSPAMLWRNLYDHTDKFKKPIADFALQSSPVPVADFVLQSFPASTAGKAWRISYLERVRRLIRKQRPRGIR